MKKAILSAIGLALFANTTYAARPNITDFEIPFFQFSKYSSASILSKKGASAGGSTETKSVALNRFDVGMFRERYDNKFSEFSLFYGKSTSGDESLVNGAEDAKIENLYGLAYASGLHVSPKVNWALSMEIASADVKIDGDRETDLGIGIGTRLTYAPIQYFELGFNLKYNSHYSAGGLMVRASF